MFKLTFLLYLCFAEFKLIVGPSTDEIKTFEDAQPSLTNGEIEATILRNAWQKFKDAELNATASFTRKNCILLCNPGTKRASDFDSYKELQKEILLTERAARTIRGYFLNWRSKERNRRLLISEREEWKRHYMHRN
ncbi:hypothetical protein ILUMI_02017 [Ignelater luminosus]|uniref:Uncharacterized protein n=1 Tax=Ignelater luminosus TaxID=2038154 RepID=A0A8K0DIH6_IGNLU|nr:hypothetical protein ILUMI_02017 [Ignelater luminosus]